jgi:hypothetical protein
MFKTLAIACALGIPVAHAAPVVAMTQTVISQTASRTHDGKVTSVAEGKLVMTDTNGKNQHTHVITPTAKIVLDGASAKLIDLKAGDAVKVTTTPEGVVTLVEATRVASNPT